MITSSYTCLDPGLGWTAQVGGTEHLLVHAISPLGQGFLTARGLGGR